MSNELKPWKRELLQRTGMDRDYLNEWLNPMSVIPFLRAQNQRVPIKYIRELNAPKRNYEQWFSSHQQGAAIIAASDESKMFSIALLVAQFNEELRHKQRTYDDALPYYTMIKEILDNPLAQ